MAGLADQCPDCFSGHEGLVGRAFDVGAAVEDLVLLQAGVPLPDFVHPDDPAVLPVPASVAAFGGWAGAAEADDPHVGGEACAAGGDQGAVADLGGVNGGDLLLAQPPERIQEPGHEGVAAVFDLLAGGVLADDPVFCQPVGGCVFSGGLT